MPYPLDRYDRVLLAAIQEDARLPQSALGQRANLSTAAVNRRLRQLAEAGVIERYSACLQPKAVGCGLTLVVEVKAESERADLLGAMRAGFQDCPQVQQCYYVTGEWDFILVCVVRDMAQYTALTRQLFFQSNNVKRFRTLVTMDPVKVSLDVPVLAGG